MIRDNRWPGFSEWGDSRGPVDASVSVDDPINADWHRMWEQVFDALEAD